MAELGGNQVVEKPGVNILKEQKGQSEWQLVFRQLIRNKGAILGVFLLIVILSLITLAPYITPFDPLVQSRDPADRLSAPSRSNLMGTDDLRRDIFARVLYGGRTTIQVAVTSILAAIGVGVFIGLIAGYYGGWLDNLIGRLIDVLLTLPGVLLAIAVIAILGPGLQNTMIAVAISNVPIFVRLVRGATIAEKYNSFVEASRSLGATHPHIILRHILPNVLAPVIVMGSLNIAAAIQVVAGLSFLGLGAQPPHPEWGAMLSNGRNYMRSGEWWMTVFPGLAIFLTVLAINLLGDGLRDALDPRLRSKR